MTRWTPPTEVHWPADTDSRWSLGAQSRWGATAEGHWTPQTEGHWLADTDARWALGLEGHWGTLEEIRWTVLAQGRWPMSSETRWGGELALYEEVTEISSAQLLGLHNQHVVISPTPAAGQFIFPLDVLLTHNFGSVAYSYVTPNLYISTPDEWTGPFTGYWGFCNAGNTLGNGTASVSPASRWTVAENNQVTTEGIDGSPLALFRNSDEPLTTGDGTATARVVYTILDT